MSIDKGTGYILQLHNFVFNSPSGSFFPFFDGSGSITAAVSPFCTSIAPTASSEVAWMADDASSIPLSITDKATAS